MGFLLAIFERSVPCSSQERERKLLRERCHYAGSILVRVQVLLVDQGVFLVAVSFRALQFRLNSPCFTFLVFGAMNGYEWLRRMNGYPMVKIF